MEQLFPYLTFAVVVFGSSVISGIVGMVGGMILLSAMGLWFPPTVLIPLHGCIQLVSNGSRAVLLHRDLDRKSVLWFSVGALGAAALGSRGVPSLPPEVLQLTIGSSCLLLVWLPLLLERLSPTRTTDQTPQPLRMTALGAGMTFLSLMAGAIGPLLDAFMVGRGLTKEGLMATKAAFQVISHSLKIVVFAAGGFVLMTWGMYLLVAIPASVLGNLVGQNVMKSIPQRAFMLSLRVLVSVFAILMLGRLLSW